MVTTKIIEDNAHVVTTENNNLDDIVKNLDVVAENVYDNEDYNQNVDNVNCNAHVRFSIYLNPV